MSDFRFTVYVAGPRSRPAVAALVALLDARLGQGRYLIDVVDVLEATAEADAARILVTPTIVRTHPGPVVRVIGDLSASERVADALDLPTPMAP